jgi:hypothetical protein
MLFCLSRDGDFGALPQLCNKYVRLPKRGYLKIETCFTPSSFCALVATLSLLIGVKVRPSPAIFTDRMFRVVVEVEY